MNRVAADTYGASQMVASGTHAEGQVQGHMQGIRDVRDRDRQ